MLPLNNMREILIVMLTILLVPLTGCDATHVKVIDLRCEYRETPLGIDNTAPRFSWKILDHQKTRGQKQTAFQILVSSSIGELKRDHGDMWDSGITETAQSVNNVYAGKALTSNQECFWKVRVWDMDGKSSDWSEPARFSTGLLKKSDWKGEWILKEDQLKTDHNWYRKNFELDDKAHSAFLYLGSFGYHEVFVNGKKITDNVLNPVSSYMKKRIPYLTYDIRDFLEKGDNVIAVWHAAGWARWRRIREYRNIPFVLKAQVEIAAGNEQISYGTDTTWKCKKSNSEYYGDWDILRFGGETIDDRFREDDWNTAGYDDGDWMNASVYDPALLNARIPEGDNISFAINGSTNRTVRAEYSDIDVILSAQMVEPQVRYREVNPIHVKDNMDGTYRIDMGENYTGFIQMDLRNGKGGDSVLFEISDQTELVMNWKQKSKYIFGKTGKGQFTNRFNLAGGRWITVYGLNYQPAIEDIKGYVVTNDRKRISHFECSDTLLNRIYEVNLNTYLANTMDGILVDCPHRERRGWGEVTVAAMYGDAFPNFESGAYMDQYSQYMRDTQLPDGQTRAVINEEDRPFLMWKANNPITLWEAYTMTGDKKILRDNYASMQKWMTWMHRSSNYETGGALKIGERGKREMPGLGDWCTPRGNFWDSSNSPEAAHFNNCVYAFMLGCALNISAALNNAEYEEIYADRLKVQQKATHEQSYDPESGKYLDGRQVNQAFALLSGVTPPRERDKVSAQLTDNVLYKFPYYDTGSSGQGLYTRYFTEFGERMDLIYELLKDSRHPGYGYFIRQGKTVWPERWSAIGNSQIHTCYTGIGGYFIKGFGGIRPDREKAGMQHFMIKPSPVGNLTYANTSYTSMYGKIVVNWKKAENGAAFHIEVPVNTTAKVYIPASDSKYVSEGSIPTEQFTDIRYLGTEKSEAVGNYLIFNVGSGIYNFNVTEMPKTTYPDPLIASDNLALIGRVNASSMTIKTEKLPEFEAFRVNDERIETMWMAGSQKDEWIELEWITPQQFNNIVIEAKGNNVNAYKIQYFSGTDWIEIAAGTSLGLRKEHYFDTVTASKCRLFIASADDRPMIAEFEVYHKN